MRTYDADIVSKAVAFFRKTEADFDPVEWISNHANIALRNDTGDMAVFEHETPGVVTGHYWFESRGRKAIDAGKSFLDELFNPEYNVQLVRGLTPITNLGARWMSRRLGFTSHGVVNTTIGPHEIFIMHRTEYIP